MKQNILNNYVKEIFCSHKNVNLLRTKKILSLPTYQRAKGFFLPLLTKKRILLIRQEIK